MEATIRSNSRVRDMNVSEDVIQKMIRKMVRNQVLTKKLVSAEVLYVLHALPPRAPRAVIEATIVSATSLPWSTLAQAGWAG